ncbi:MAG: hypothetical protein RQ801_12820, partial [Spirochaetaceae bacterium]|nr:hypothetical protein [Spirochaetaceae bacterium]
MTIDKVHDLQKAFRKLVIAHSFPGRLVDITQEMVGIDSDLALLEASPTLPAGLTRLYFELTYSAMAEGVAWERGLYRGEELVQGG